jgi:hypothetical protein
MQITRGDFANIAISYRQNYGKSQLIMAEITTTGIQDKLLGRIKRILPESMSIVDVLSELLEVSTDSVYRRLRNETSLTIQEVSKICEHFNISFDELNTIDNASSVTFTFKPLATVDDYKGYLISIRDDMARFSMVPESTITWAAEDIPIFHHFRYPFLGTFKVYYWFHCIIHTEEHKDRKFNPGLIDEEIRSLCEEIYNLYARIPSVEIWTDLTVASLFAQVDYVWQSGLFEKREDALEVCSLIEQQFNKLQKEAELTYKLGFDDQPILGEDSFKLYHSDIEIGNNTIFVNTGANKILYLTHNTMNKIVTVNRQFCETTERWIENLKRKSNLISGVSEKQRYQFFNRIKSQLKAIEKRIQEDPTFPY